MAIDIGDKWIGVAVSDPLCILASPLTIIERRNDVADLKAVNDIISEKQVKTLVAGLPRMLDGSIGRQAEKVNLFIDQLRAVAEIPIEIRDECLTTVTARHMMYEAGGRKAMERRDDAVAAAVILQAFLDES